MHPDCKVEADVAVLLPTCKAAEPDRPKRAAVMSSKFSGPCTFFWPNPDTDTHP